MSERFISHEDEGQSQGAGNEPAIQEDMTRRQQAIPSASPSAEDHLPVVSIGQNRAEAAKRTSTEAAQAASAEAAKTTSAEAVQAPRVEAAPADSADAALSPYIAAANQPKQFKGPVSASASDAESPPQVSDLKRLYEKHSALIDADHNGRISGKELAAVIKNPNLTDEQIQLVAALYGMGHVSSKDHVARPDMTDITKEKIDQIESDYKTLLKEMSELPNPSDPVSVLKLLLSNPDYQQVNFLAGRMRIAHDQMSTSSELFTNTAKPQDSISPDAVKQGLVGDCSFLSAVGALAASPQGQEAICKMIEKNADGTYKVVFPGAPNQPITVEPPTKAEMSIFNSGSPYGTWVPVLEKAFGKYCNEHLNGASHQTPSDQEAGDHRHIGVALGLLTGKQIDGDSTSWTRTSTTSRKLEETIAKGLPVVAATGNSVSHEYLIAAHAYSVLGYDKAAGVIKLQDPNRTAKSDAVSIGGIFELTVDEFDDAFNDIWYAY